MSDLDISGENGFLENAQFLILVLAGVILIRGAIYLARNRDTSQLAYCLVLLVMPIVEAGRELSFGREINFTPDMVFACEVTLGIICLFLLISGFILFLRSPEPKLSLLWGYIRDRSSISIYIAILVFAAADIFEGGGFGIPRSELAEEILEVIAFCFILRAAFLVTSNSQKT